MEQIVWTLIGVLTATVLGNFWYLGSKIDSINARIDGQGDSINARIDALGARLDARIDALSGQLQAHIERHAS